MPGISSEQRALRYVEAFETAGKTVDRVIVDGRRIELVLKGAETLRDDGFDVDWNR